MTTKEFKKYAAALITGIALFVFFYTLQHALWGTATSADTGNENVYVAEQKTTAATDTPQNFAMPARIKIPSITVDAKVQQVGLTATHAMGIPTNFTDVAWYKYGAVPGEAGTAVIDGHVDNGLGLAGVFKKLDQLQRGDNVTIVDKNGTEIHFKVIDIREYPYNDAPSEEIFGSTGRALLRLITCDGKWVKSAKTYDTRLVVTAEYIP